MRCLMSWLEWIFLSPPTSSRVLTLTRINRKLVFLPRSLASLIKLSAGVRNGRAWFEAKGLSDRAPILLVLTVSTPKPPIRLPLKPQWCKHPVFKARLDDLCAVIDSTASSPEEHSALLRELQTDAALFVRDGLPAQDPDVPQCFLMRMSSIPRCVWSRDMKLFRTSNAHSEAAKQHLGLDYGCLVPQNPEKFEGAIRKLKEADYGRQRKAILADGHVSASQKPIGFNRKKRN